MNTGSSALSHENRRDFNGPGAVVEVERMELDKGAAKGFQRIQHLSASSQ